ncbi:MAG: DUF488 family protein [Pseudomonadota bacterium]
MTQTLFTIGFTRSTAEHFFGRLERAGVRLVADTRLEQHSQLAGFAKQPNLAFFLDRVAGIACRDEPLLAPDEAAFRAYRAGALLWDDYAAAYLRALQERRVAERLDPAAFASACLLCSEAEPHHCHRRLAAEHLTAVWSGVWRVVHL